ncbi:hypothetical protein BBJ28_00018585 [Nothophytophthora sp. Chile5]|nr:hypothetical protein BBJ28_00018585 [Nothophytophthora sp. Chile5]
MPLISSLPSLLQWRDRFVIIRTGELIVRRRREGAIKAKVDLLDSSVKLTFHGGQSLLTISTHGHDVVLDCRSSSARDEWINAIVSAQERPGADVDCDGDGTELLSGDETDDHEAGTGPRHRSSARSQGTDRRDSLDADSESYNEALLALQGVRDSVMQCHLSMSSAEIDSFLTPCDVANSDAPSTERRLRNHATRGEEELRWKRLRALLSFIENVPHGGRVVLLHLCVVASAGITVGDMLLALGEKQRDNPRRGSFTPRTVSTQKRHVAAFVRDILFHPIYSKREEVNTEVVQELVDLFFPHCRLRRFSDDTERQTPPPASRVASAADKDVAAAASASASASTTPLPVPTQMRRKRRNHSFPNLLGLSQLAKSTGLLQPSSCADNAGSIPPTKPPGSEKSDPPGVLSAGAVLQATATDDSDDAVLLEPLRSLLWELSCSELAEQLTIFHHSQLSRVYPWEFLHHPKEAAKDLTAHFNRLVAYFVWSVLVEDTPKERAEVIEDIIAIAMAASAPPLNNFHLVMACVGCLGDTPLMSSRLPTTWKKVRAKAKTRLTELRRLCDHTGGFENLRRKQSDESDVTASSSTLTSVIPFIGVVGVMLERLRTASYFTPKKLLDLEKLERQYLALNVLENALLKPPPRPSKGGVQQRGKAVLMPGEPVGAVTQRLQQFLSDLSMDFATPRLLQLRSQQILANEAAAANASSSSFLLAATVATATGSSRGAAASSGSKGESQLPISVSVSDDAFLSFRAICSLLEAVPDTRERLHVALELLFVDERQPATRFLRQFWLDFKQNVWLAAIQPTLQGVRSCIATLLRDVVASKSTELLQLSGLAENAAELHALVYEKLVVLVLQPIYGTLVAKVQRVHAAEDAHAAARVLAMQNAPPGSREAAELGCGGAYSSPVELLEAVAQLVTAPKRPEGAVSAGEAATDQPLMTVELLGALQALQGRQRLLVAHLGSSLRLLRELLDVAYVAQDRRQALDAFDAAVAWLRRRGGPRTGATQP